MKRFAKIFLLLVLLSVFNLPVKASNEVILSPSGEYKAIDTKLAMDSIAILNQGTGEDKQQVIDKILASPDKYAPPVFYALSNVLFNQGKKDDAAFWFYAGQLRARFDANRCADVSAREAVAVLNDQYGTQINQYTFKNIPMLKALIPKVIEWDRKTPHNYDHRWINLHGMGAVMASLDDQKNDSKESMSLPKNQWDSIAEKTRRDYLNNFNEAMAEMDKRNSKTN